MIKIIDYDHSCGLSHGFEDGTNFIVEGNLALNKLNHLNYNNHLLLDHHLDSNPDLDKMDMFIACPNFGDGYEKRGGHKFSLDDLNICLGIISLKIPDYILIAVSQSAITPLQIEKTVTETYEGIPTNDLVICKLKEMGYTSQFFTIDPVTYRLPQHKITGFYFAAKKELFDKPIKIPDTERGSENTSVCDWLKSLCNKAVNFHNEDWSHKDICEKIKPGSNAKKTSDVNITSGYIRLNPKLPAPYLGSTFYNVSSKRPSIHPYFDRPLTIREGALLHGLPNSYVWDPKTSKKDVAIQIDQSISPMIGYKIKMGLLNAIG